MTLQTDKSECSSVLQICVMHALLSLLFIVQSCKNTVQFIALNFKRRLHLYTFALLALRLYLAIFFHRADFSSCFGRKSVFIRWKIEEWGRTRADVLQASSHLLEPLLCPLHLPNRAHHTLYNHSSNFSYFEWNIFHNAVHLPTRVLSGAKLVLHRQFLKPTLQMEHYWALVMMSLLNAVLSALLGVEDAVCSLSSSISSSFMSWAAAQDHVSIHTFCRLPLFQGCLGLPRALVLGLNTTHTLFKFDPGSHREQHQPNSIQLRQLQPRVCSHHSVPIFIAHRHLYLRRSRLKDIQDVGSGVQERSKQQRITAPYMRVSQL